VGGGEAACLQIGERGGKEVHGRKSWPRSLAGGKKGNRRGRRRQTPLLCGGPPCSVGEKKGGAPTPSKKGGENTPCECRKKKSKGVIWLEDDLHQKRAVHERRKKKIGGEKKRDTPKEKGEKCPKKVRLPALEDRAPPTSPKEGKKEGILSDPGR